MASLVKHPSAAGAAARVRQRRDHASSRFVLGLSRAGYHSLVRLLDRSARLRAPIEWRCAAEELRACWMAFCRSGIHMASELLAIM